MSLRIDTTKCHEPDLIHANLKETTAFLMMACGINVITHVNAADCYARITLWETLHGAMRKTADGDARFCVTDVQRMIGAHVNVTTEPEAKWCKRIVREHFMQEARSLYQRNERR